jgi:hypothetical protein
MNPVHHSHYAETVCKSIGAIGINALALITSFQEQVEWWLRIASLTVAIGYTGTMLFRAMRHKPKRDR